MHSCHFSSCFGCHGNKTVAVTVSKLVSWTGHQDNISTKKTYIYVYKYDTALHFYHRKQAKRAHRSWCLRLSVTSVSVKRAVFYHGLLVMRALFYQGLTVVRAVFYHGLFVMRALFYQGLTVVRAVFHQGCSVMRALFYQGLTVIRAVFHQGCYVMMTVFIRNFHHEGSLLSGISAIMRTDFYQKLS